MSDIETMTPPTNVTPLRLADPTGASRSRRYRKAQARGVSRHTIAQDYRHASRHAECHGQEAERRHAAAQGDGARGAHKWPWHGPDPGTAAAIAALALTINAQTGWRFGTTPLAGITFAGLSIAADVLAIILPSAAVALWSGRHALSGGAWATWVLAASMATLVSVGFASLHISDSAAARAAVVTIATETANQRNAAIEAARTAAQAATVARQGECQRRGPRCRGLEHSSRPANCRPPSRLPYQRSRASPTLIRRSLVP